MFVCLFVCLFDHPWCVVVCVWVFACMCFMCGNLYVLVCAFVCILVSCLLVCSFIFLFYDVIYVCVRLLDRLLLYVSLIKHIEHDFFTT